MHNKSEVFVPYIQTSDLNKFVWHFFFDQEPVQLMIALCKLIYMYNELRIVNKSLILSGTPFDLYESLISVSLKEKCKLKHSATEGKISL